MDGAVIYEMDVPNEVCFIVVALLPKRAMINALRRAVPGAPERWFKCEREKIKARVRRLGASFDRRVVAAAEGLIVARFDLKINDLNARNVEAGFALIRWLEKHERHGVCAIVHGDSD